ncbi:zinc finger, PHD-type containing protein [Tanacetum coccineum]
MESLQHFSHDHLLSLIHLQKNKNNVNSDDDDEEEKEGKDDDDFVVEDQHVGQCNMCEEPIYLFHLCYYKCNDCVYSLHKFCAELPTTEKNHPLHPGHDLTLSQGFQFHESDLKHNSTIHSPWKCFICNRLHEMSYNYHCSICKYSMDIICATASPQKIDHPGHPHQLERINKPILSHCNGCTVVHEGTFYQCTTCYGFMIHLNCALLPAKLQIQRFTDNIFSHSHLLTLAYSFPYDEYKSKFFPLCKVSAQKFTFTKI